MQPNLDPVTSDDIANVRAFAREVARRHGIRIHVRKTRRGAINICGTDSVAARIELCEGLAARGYEDELTAFGPDMTLTDKVKLSREYQHGSISFGVMRLRS